MTSGEAIVLAGILIAMTFLIVFKAYESEHLKNKYHEGWKDRAELEAEMQRSPEEDAVLKTMKTAMKQYMRTSCMYRRGDSGKIDNAEDFKGLKDVVYELTIRRKELEK